MSRKLDRLESLRGVAALIVVFWHFYELFGLRTDYDPKGLFPFSIFRAIVTFLPGRILLDGQFAVLVFFVLSGFVLSVHYLGAPKGEYLRSAVLRRIPRLVIPSLASLIICFVLLKSGCWITSVPMQGMEEISQKRLLEDNDLSRNVAPFLKECLYVFIRHGAVYNRVLWTMSWEIAGSFLVFAIIGITAGLKRRWIMYIALIAYCLVDMNDYYLEFILGVIFCDLFLHFSDSRLLRYFAGIACLGAILAMALIHPESAYASYSGNVRRLLNLQRPLCAAGVVAGAIWATPMRYLLDGKAFVGLGKISFATYLLHLPLYFTFSDVALSAMVNRGVNYGTALDVTFALSMICLIVLASLFTRYVDVPAIAASKAFDRWICSEPAPKTAPSGPRD